MKTSKLLSTIVAAAIGLAIATFAAKQENTAEALEPQSQDYKTQIKENIDLENQGKTAIESLSENDVTSDIASKPPTTTSEKLTYMITLKTNKGDIVLKKHLIQLKTLFNTQKMANMMELFFIV